MGLSRTATIYDIAILMDNLDYGVNSSVSYDTNVPAEEMVRFWTAWGNLSDICSDWNSGILTPGCQEVCTHVLSMLRVRLTKCIDSQISRLRIRNKP